MAEKLVEVQVCQSCGADVRLNAFFCYNCGSQVVPDEILEAEETDNKVSNAWFKESITEQNIEPLAEQKIVDKSGIELTPLAVAETTAIEAGIPPLEIETEPEKTEIKPETSKTKSLKTASSLRQKPKLPPKKKVEVTWEAPRSAPNVWFLSVALILLLLAVGLVIAMLYVR